MADETTSFSKKIFDNFADLIAGHLAAKVWIAVSAFVGLVVGWLGNLSGAWIILAFGVLLGMILLVLVEVLSGLMQLGRERLAPPLFWALSTIIAILISLFGICGYELYALRSDIDQYVLPRQLEPWQTAKIVADLSNHDTYDDLKVDYSKNDQEAQQYASEITSALSQAGWVISGGNVVDTDQTGVSVEIENVPGPWIKPDRKHLSPVSLLLQALADARVTNGSGGDSNQPIKSVTILIGHRPLMLNPPSRGHPIVLWW